MSSPGPAFALALDALILVAAVALVGYWWLTRVSGGGTGGTSDPVEEWHEEAAALAREVQRVAEASEGVADRDQVQRRVVPLSERIKGHARSAPAGVDESLVGNCYALGVDSYEVGMEHTIRETARTGRFLEDELDRLGTRAETFEAAVRARSGDGEQGTNAGS